MKTVILTIDEFSKLLDLVQARKQSCRRTIKQHQGQDRRDRAIAGKAAAALRRWEAIEWKLVYAEPPTLTLLAGGQK